MVDHVEDSMPIPAAIEAEQAVVGAMLTHPRAIAETRELLTPADFLRPAHEAIFAAALDMADRHVKVDPVTMLTELERREISGRVGGAPYLHTLYAGVATVANVVHYALAVRAAARRRTLIQTGQRLMQIAVENTDLDDALTLAARESLSLNLLVDETEHQRPIPGLSTWREFLDRTPRGLPWLVPGLMMLQDVWMLLAGEGGGKSWFTRQFCLAIAAGVHPFYPDRHIPPRRTLHIDLENPAPLVAEESTVVEAAVEDIAGTPGEKAFIWHKPSGLDLRTRADAQLFERAIAETEAEVVTLGSLYKAFTRRGDSWDQAAEECRAVFDRIRERYNIALVLEAHQPKGSGGSDRPNTPFGSQQWIGWASVGRTIRRVGDNMFRLEQFRGDRGPRPDIPPALTRGGRLPWSPVFDEMEIKYGTWPELLTKDDRKELGL